MKAVVHRITNACILKNREETKNVDDSNVRNTFCNAKRRHPRNSNPRGIMKLEVLPCKTINVNLGNAIRILYREFIGDTRLLLERLFVR